MTVITMSRSEIDRMSVLRDLADDRIRVAMFHLTYPILGVACERPVSGANECFGRSARRR